MIKLTHCITVFFIAMAFAIGADAPASAQSAKSWMNGDVPLAWQAGFRGQRVTITLVDRFSGTKTTGRMDGFSAQNTHGAWTMKQAKLVAPWARVLAKDFATSNRAVQLARGLNVINLSYTMYSTASASSSRWDAAEASVISCAHAGTAVVVKAAGNDNMAVKGRNGSGKIDTLNHPLVGGASTVFVGALGFNGTPNAKASLANYFNYAGNDAVVQGQFLVVGVHRAQMGLAGTSFAAPIVSGYAAILGSKFKAATAAQIAAQLLDTARTDTILNYDVALHGQGEASLSRALSPRALR